MQQMDSREAFGAEVMSFDSAVNTLRWFTDVSFILVFTDGEDTNGSSWRYDHSFYGSTFIKLGGTVAVTLPHMEFDWTLTGLLFTQLDPDWTSPGYGANHTGMRALGTQPLAFSFCGWPSRS